VLGGEGHDLEVECLPLQQYKASERSFEDWPPANSFVWLSGMCVLQCAAVCCSVLQCVAVCCSVLQCVVVCCRVSQGGAV